YFSSIVQTGRKIPRMCEEVHSLSAGQRVFFCCKRSPSGLWAGRRADEAANFDAMDRGGRGALRLVVSSGESSGESKPRGRKQRIVFDRSRQDTATVVPRRYGPTAYPVSSSPGSKLNRRAAGAGGVT